MTSLRLLPAVFLLAGSLGCTAADGPTPITPDEDVCAELGVEQSIELGDGTADFLALQEGDLVRQAWGPQGGDHVWASLRMTGVFGGGEWRDDPECEDMDGGFCGPIAPEDAPTTTIDLLHGDILVASTGDDMPFMGEGGVAADLTVFLRNPYSSAEMEWMDPTEYSQDAIDAARAVEEADLRFEAEVRDACGTVLTAEQTVRIEIPWLENVER